MHPHKTKGQRRRERSRAARLAWRNYAILEGLKAVFDNGFVTLYSDRDGVVYRSTKISITVSPLRIIENPRVLAWVFDFYATTVLGAERGAQAIRQRIDSAIIETLLAGDRHRRASRAK